MLADLTYSQFAVVWCAVAGAYVIFSIAGFGSGGFLYSIYLTGRIDDKNRVGITQSTLKLTREQFIKVVNVVVLVSG